MSAMASQITGIPSVCSILCSGADQRKHQSSASLVFGRGIHRWTVDSPHKGAVTRKMFLFDDVIMILSTHKRHIHLSLRMCCRASFARWKNITAGHLLRGGKISYHKEIRLHFVENLALGKDAWHSSLYGSYIPDHAVDGNRGTNIDECTRMGFCKCSNIP